MPREQDTVALLKRLLAKEVTDVDDNEVLDEIITLKDPLPPSDAVTVTETADFRAIAGYSEAGFCEACEQLAEGLGTALRFDGVNDYALVPHSAALNPTAQLTLEAKATFSVFKTGTNQGQVLIRKDGAYILYQYEANIDFYLYGLGRVSYPVTSLQTGRLYHIAATYDGTTMRLLVDGAQVASIPATGAIPSTTNDVYLGKSQGNEYFLQGVKCEARIWNVARTQAEIAANMYANLTGEESGLVGLWKFNEGTGTTAGDSTANNNDGTISGATWITRLDSYPAQADVTTAPGDVKLYRPTLSFSRASVAYNPETGAQVASGAVRYVSSGINDDPTAGMLSHSGLSAFDAANILDNQPDSNGWHTDSAVAGAYLLIDLGAGNEKAYVRSRIYAIGANNGVYDVQYSDNGADWTTAAANFGPFVQGWNQKSWSNVGAHRYWRLLLTNTPGSGAWLGELEMYRGPIEGQAILVENEALYLSFGMTSNGGNAYYYADMTSVSDYVIQSGDHIEYEICWPADSPTVKQISFDYTTSDGANLRDSGVSDQNGVLAHPTTDLSAYASGRWYSRKIALSSAHVGKTITFFDLVCEYDSGGTVAGMIRNIRITNGAGVTRKSIWQGGGAPTLAKHLSAPSTGNTLTITKIESETLTFPSTGISATEGCWRQWVYMTDVAKRQVAGKYPMVFAIDKANGAVGLYLAHEPNSANWRLTSFNDAGTGAAHLFADSYTPNGWCLVEVKWRAGQLKAFVNGVAVVDVAPQYWPTTFGGSAFVGCSDLADGPALNTYHDDLHILDYYPTDQESADYYARTAPAEPTADTVALVPFDGSLTALYPSEATITTVVMDLGGTLPTRPVLLFPTLDGASPAGTSATIVRYQMKAAPGDAWGAWETPTSLPSGGYLTLTAPLRYIQMEVQLATTDTTQTPTLIGAGVFD